MHHEGRWVFNGDVKIKYLLVDLFVSCVSPGTFSQVVIQESKLNHFLCAAALNPFYQVK